MSKSILVIDTPNSCAECILLELNNSICIATGYNMSKGEAEQKPKWCPLREIPQKKPCNSMGEWLDFNCGYNNCIDEILKECD